MCDANAEMRKRTGSIDGDKLDAFLYVLARDHLPVGVLEEIITDMTPGIVDFQFTNGYLARYAQDLKARLL